MLKNKVILVTGSTNGIGEAIAAQCIEHGAKVMLHGRSQENAERAVKKYGTENAAYIIADLENDFTAAAQVVEATVKQFGRIDGIVNNAGRSPRHTIDTVTQEKFDNIVALNLRAPLFVIQAAVKYFRQQGGGAVVNIGSINAHTGQADLLAYSITKGGLMTMTRNLANALASEKIRVNQLNVGWTMTANESRIKESEGFAKDWETKLPPTYAPSGQLLRPADIAHHAVFWLSSVSAPANGVVYELEQYPVVGRNLINELPLEMFKK